MNTPYIVAGAGPAGLAASITLARAGAGVVLYERGSDVGRQYDGNLQMLTNYPDRKDALDELRELAPDTGVRSRAQHCADLYTPSNTLRQARSEKPFGYMIMRGPGGDMLDGALRDAALRAGVEIKTNTRIDPADAHIVATGGGHVSGIAREWFGEVDIEDCFAVHFDNRYTPGGYGYLLVSGGRAVLGAAVTRKFNRIGRAFDLTVSWFKERYALPEITKHTNSGRASLFLAKSGRDESGRLFAGEAGGFSDFFLGFGIRSALQSGRLAAESLLADADYDTKWKKFFDRRIEMGLLNRFAYEMLGNSSYRLLLRLATTGDFRRMGSWLYEPNIFKLCILPVVRAVWRGNAPEHLTGRCDWIRKPVD